MKLKVSRKLKYKIWRFIVDKEPHKKAWDLSYYGIHFISDKLLKYKHYYYWVKKGEITCTKRKFEEVDEHDIIDIYEFYKLLQKLPTWKRFKKGGK